MEELSYTERHYPKIAKLLKKSRAIKAPDVLMQNLEALRDMVENINQQPDLALRGGVYKELAKADVYTVSHDGCEFGYKLEDHGLFIRRKVYLTFPGYRLSEIPPEQQEPFMVAAMEIFLDRGQSMPDVEVVGNDKSFLYTQDFMPLLLHRVGKKKPGFKVLMGEN